MVELLGRFSIKLEPSSFNTQDQNGAAERLGGVIKDKERVMRIEARLPHQLWPEIGKTAVYLHVRTPSKGSDGKWQTPYARFHEAVAQARGIPNARKRPDQTHLRAFGCKVYAITSDAQLKKNRLQRLAFKA
jgi:hypothetical protein